MSDPVEAALCEPCTGLQNEEVWREHGRGYAFDNFQPVRHPDGQHLFIRSESAGTGLDVDGVVAELMGVEGLLDQTVERLRKATNTLARLSSSDTGGQG